MAGKTKKAKAPIKASKFAAVKKAIKPAKGGKLAAIGAMILGGGKKNKAVVKVAKVSKAVAAAPILASATPPKKEKKSKSKDGRSIVEGMAIAAIEQAQSGKNQKREAAIESSRGLDDKFCREAACEGLATTSGYCRLHYIKNWKKIKRKELILKEGKLNRYIEELVAKYPDKYIEAIRGDLASDKEFSKVVRDLELDESIEDFDADADNVDSLIDSIRRDMDDEGETF